MLSAALSMVNGQFYSLSLRSKDLTLNITDAAAAAVIALVRPNKLKIMKIVPNFLSQLKIVSGVRSTVFFNGECEYVERQ